MWQEEPGNETWVILGMRLGNEARVILGMRLGNEAWE